MGGVGVEWGVLWRGVYHRGVGCVMEGWGGVYHGGGLSWRVGWVTEGWGWVGCVMEGGLSWSGGVCHGGVGWGGVRCVMEGGLSWRGGVGHIQNNLVIEANHHYLHTIPPGNYSKLLGEPNSITTTHLITWNYWGSKNSITTTHLSVSN